MPLVSCDGVLIERVLVNLVENATKYTPPGTPIRIAARATGVIEVAIEDRGPGLPPGRERAIFDKFARGNPESVVPGVGLGLAICRAIVEAHRGTIRAEFDPRSHELMQVSAQGMYSWTGRVQLTGGWSKKSFIKDLAGFNDPRVPWTEGQQMVQTVRANGAPVVYVRVDLNDLLKFPVDEPHKRRRLRR